MIISWGEIKRIQKIHSLPKNTVQIQSWEICKILWNTNCRNGLYLWFKINTDIELFKTLCKNEKPNKDYLIIKKENGVFTHINN